MDKTINPLDWDMDLLWETKSSIVRKLNPLNWRLEIVYSANSYIQKINPYTWDFDMVWWISAIIKEVTWTWSINLTNAVRNQLVELKAYWGTELRILPSWYTQLKYITFDWDSYFDTWLVINSFDVIVKSKHSITTENVTPSLMWWYMWDSSNLPRRWVWRYQSYFLWWANSTTGSWSWSFDTNVHEFTGRVYTNSEEQIMREMSMDWWSPSSSTLSNQDVWSSNELSIYVWARNNVWGVWNFITWDFYNLNLIQNWICIWNIVPAIRNSDMTVWLYNTITDTFLTNLWTWTVTAWPNAVPTPEIPMNIVCNNGVLKVSPNLANYISSNVTLWYWIGNSNWEPQSSSPNFYTAMFKIKPDTSYVFYGRSKTDNSLSRRNRVAWYDENWTWIRNFTAYVDWVASVDTSPSNAAYARFHCNPNSSDVTQEIVDDYNWVFQEWTAEVTYIPYWQINYDWTTETIWVCGKNLFDKTTADSKRIFGFFASSGTTWTYADAAFSVRIPCKPNTQYTARYNGDSTQAVLGFGSTSNDDAPTSENRTITVTQGVRQNSPTIDTPITITTGADDKWLIVAYNIAEPQHSDMADNLQIEVGSTATTYTQYYYGGTATCQPLLKIWDYEDIQEILSWNITRNVGIKVLDGTEDITLSSRFGGYGFYFALRGKQTIVINDNAICSHFSRTFSYSSYNQGIYDTSGFFTENTTKLQFQQYLADQYAAWTPVIIVYPLAEATTETTAWQDINIQTWSNTISITQASINNLKLYAKYKWTE